MTRADQIRASASDLEYSLLPSDDLRTAAIVHLAKQYHCSTQEVLRALTRKPGARGRPTKPKCPACGATIRERKTERPDREIEASK